MLQFIAESNERYSIAETVQMAIEGGCRWIELHMPDSDDSEIREVASELIPLCRESGVFLTIEDRPGFARELGLHGVVMTSLATTALKFREDLGPEAIIGLRVATTPAVVAIQNADIDYVTLPPDMPVGAIAQFMDELKPTGITIPVVATGNINLENAAAYMATGISGVATATPAYAKDPVEYTSRLIEALEKSKC